MKLCSVSGKRCYGSKHAAVLHSKLVGNRLRAYVCPSCHCWHVTSHVQAPVFRHDRRPRVNDGGES